MLPDGAVAAKLIEVIRKTLSDLRPREVDRSRITLDSALDRDLGLDSLARVELFTRVERDFGVRLPESVFETAERVRDISAALRGASTPAVLPPMWPILRRSHTMSCTDSASSTGWPASRCSSFGTSSLRAVIASALVKRYSWATGASAAAVMTPSP